MYEARFCPACGGDVVFSTLLAGYLGEDPNRHRCASCGAAWRVTWVENPHGEGPDTEALRLAERTRHAKQ